VPYRLVQLARGAYDVQLDGVVVASLVQSRTSKRWYAELLDDAQPLPAPFENVEHAFARYADAVTWCGDPQVIHTADGEVARRTILSRRT
jgi:hypothetical protein